MAVAEAPTSWHEDIVDEIGRFQPVLLDCVREELQRLASTHGRRSRTARVALGLASGFRRCPCGKGAVDDEIISAAASLEGGVATLDENLARSAKAVHLTVISLSGGRVAIK